MQELKHVERVVEAPHVPIMEGQVVQKMVDRSVIHRVERICEAPTVAERDVTVEASQVQVVECKPSSAGPCLS